MSFWGACNAMSFLGGGWYYIRLKITKKEDDKIALPDIKSVSISNISLFPNIELESTNLNIENSDKEKPSKAFMAMFMGFVDGDGYIEIGPQKQYHKDKSKIGNPESTIRARLVIRLHVRDTSLLEYFQKILNTGKITFLVKENQKRLIFTKASLETVILPLIKEYNLSYYTYNRLKQNYNLKFIIDNKLSHWSDLDLKTLNSKFETHYEELTKTNLLPLMIKNIDFQNWVVGFSMAEAWFGSKPSSPNTRYFQIRQTGAENLYLLKAICLLVTGRDAYKMNPDKDNSYQLVISANAEILKVIAFFSSNSLHPLYGYKAIQFATFCIARSGGETGKI